MKNRKKDKYPQLSAADKLLGNITGGLLILTAFLIVYSSYFSVTYKQYFTDGVLAVDNGILFILSVPLVIYLLVVGGICFGNQNPILGNPKVNYDNLKPRFKQVKPIFDKRYINKKTILKFTAKILLIIVIGIAAIVLFDFSTTSRYQLTDNGIDKYSIFNNQTSHWSFNDVQNYELYVEPYRYISGHKPLFKHYSELYIQLELNDGKVLSFGSENFKDVKSLHQANQLLGEAKKTVDSYGVEAFIKSRHFTDEEEQMITNLFD